MEDPAYVKGTILKIIASSIIIHESDVGIEKNKTDSAVFLFLVCLMKHEGSVWLRASNCRSVEHFYAQYLAGFVSMK